jgi:hypothetical protein
MTNLAVPVIAAVCLAFVVPPGQGREGAAGPKEFDWKVAMARVHARFGERAGTFAHFGDSITDTLAFWTPLQHGRKAALRAKRSARRRFSGPSNPSLARFPDPGARTLLSLFAIARLRFLGQLQAAPAALIPFAGEIAAFVQYIGCGRGLAPTTIESCCSTLR